MDEFVVMLPETDAEFAATLTPALVRVRCLAPPTPELRLAALEASVHLDDRQPIANGRLEMLHLYREQSISITLHRYGNLISAP